jgi:hypothetical protein
MDRSGKYNNFENPFYSIHRDMAYCGLSVIVAALKSYEEEIKANPLATKKLKKLGELSSVLRNLLVDEALKYENNYKMSVIKSGYLELPDEIRSEFAKHFTDIVIRFIYESIREANYGVREDIALARYNEALDNLVKVQVYVRQSFFRKIFFNLVRLYFICHRTIKKILGYFSFKKKDNNSDNKNEEVNNAEG